MNQTVKYIRVIGGKDDGRTLKVNEPWKVDASEVLRIESDGEQYKLDHIEGKTAVFTHGGFVD